MTMLHAVRIHRFGGIETMIVDDLPWPTPQDDEVLMRVEAAGVNPVDWKIREGSYPMVRENALPVILGREVAGVVEACGPRAHTLKKGDPIFAMLGQDRGGYTEFAIVKVAEMAPMPKRLDAIHAAAVPLAGLTAWQGLFDHGGLRAGQRVVIHGGAGGVGHLAIQFAKAKGAWVATTCSAQDRDFLSGLGADLTIDYRHERFEEKLEEKVDLVYDLINGETQDRSWGVLTRGGTLVSTLAEPSRAKAEAAGAHALRYTVQPNGGQLAEIARLIDAGKVKVEVERIFSLNEAAEAQQHLKHDHVRGKVVLQMLH
jgi:NADPH:quinone reductase-like Zn-dependent oxidoreductase